MKKIYLLIVMLNCCWYSIFAQRNYSIHQKSDYKSDTIVMKDYAYICDTLYNYEISLYNQENHPGREQVRHKDGTPKPQGVDVIHYSRDTHSLLRSIIDEGFSAEQIGQIDGRRLIIQIDISSLTGCVTDVYFTYFKDTHYAQIPVEVYRAMELRFKNEVQYILTEEGEKMTHYSIAWSQCPKGRAEAVVEEDTEEETDESEKETEITIATPVRGGLGKGTISPTPQRGSTIGTVVTP